MNKYFNTIFFLFFTIHLCAQENRWELDSINGIYIPANLEDCFDQINSFWNDSAELFISNRTEDKFTAEEHFGLGYWMRNNWELWGESRLSRFFNELEIYHPDDMSGIILTSYHRQSAGKDIELQKQIKKYKMYWKKVDGSILKSRTNQFKQYQIGDTIYLKYNFWFISELQEQHYNNQTCLIKAQILDRKKDDLQIKIQLIDACDPNGLPIGRYEIYDGGRLVDKDEKVDIMNQTDIRWTPFYPWTHDLFPN